MIVLHRGHGLYSSTVVVRDTDSDTGANALSRELPPRCYASARLTRHRVGVGVVITCVLARIRQREPEDGQTLHSGSITGLVGVPLLFTVVAEAGVTAGSLTAQHWAACAASRYHSVAAKQTPLPSYKTQKMNVIVAAAATVVPPSD